MTWPAPESGIQAGAGHDQVHIEPAQVGVQHHHRTGFAFELAGVLAEAAHRISWLSGSLPTYCRLIPSQV